MLAPGDAIDGQVRQVGQRRLRILWFCERLAALQAQVKAANQALLDVLKAGA